MHYLFTSRERDSAYIFRDYIQLHYQEEIFIEEHSEPEHHYQIYTSEEAIKLTEIIECAKEFTQNPFAGRFAEASWQQGNIQATEGLSANNLFSTLQRIKQNSLTTPITYLITALCILIYIVTLTPLKLQVYEWFSYPIESSQNLQVWRYLSPVFVHLSAMHIFLNLFWWLLFGALIEKTYGSSKLFQLFLFSALISNGIEDLSYGPYFFGLSGVVYAVLGYVFIMDKFNPKHNMNLPSGFIYLLIIGILIGFISPIIGIEIGNASHISGLVFGLLFAIWDILQQRIKTKEN